MEQSEYIIENLLRTINKVSISMKEPRYYGTNDFLFASEIHMIDVIGKNPGINVTEIAYKLGITKGAVPKIIRKLIQKGLIYRYQANDNKKMVLLELTNSGSIAFRRHIEFHQQFDNNINDKINLLNQNEVSLLKDIFSEIEKYIDNLNKN